MGDYYGVGFGYAPFATSKSCCEIGTIITSISGATIGDLVFSTRPTTTDVNATERLRIKSDGNVGIGTTPQTTYKVDVNGTLNATSILIDGTAITGSKWTTSGANIYYITGNVGIGGNYGFGIDGGTLDYFTGSTHRWWSGSGGTNFGTERMNLTNGNSSVNGDVFITSSRLVLRETTPTLYLRDTDNRSGMIHMNGNFMYFLNASGTDSENWTQQNGQNWALQINMSNNVSTFGGSVYYNYFVSSAGIVCNGGNIHNYGQIYAYFYSVSMSNTDYLCIQTNTGYNTMNPDWIRVAYGSFTSFHRCYTDDELYNNESDESIDLFKNNCMGRVVITSGKIKTHFSRPKETEPEPEPKIDSETGLPIENAKIPPKDKGDKWYSGIDKDGMNIEDTIPVVALSRKKKDNLNEFLEY